MGVCVCVFCLTEGVWINCKFFCRKRVRLIFFCFVLHATVDVSRALISFFFPVEGLATWQDLHNYMHVLTFGWSASTLFITCCVFWDFPRLHESLVADVPLLCCCCCFFLLLFFFWRVGKGRWGYINIPNQVMQSLHMYTCHYRTVVFMLLMFLFTYWTCLPLLHVAEELVMFYTLPLLKDIMQKNMNNSKKQAHLDVTEFLSSSYYWKARQGCQVFGEISMRAGDNMPEARRTQPSLKLIWGSEATFPLWLSLWKQ